ncbi:MAG: hypothetical protein GY945_07350 [Rhodobacteraceae bacterium]|nr:hypothetical protein [Paracoccaceae bacterium]
MKQLGWLKFEGLQACVSLQVDSEFITALPAVFSNWAYTLLSSEPDQVFANVDFSKNQYTIASPFMDAPEAFGDPVNTLCRLVVELAWAQLREQPDLLCLHGAAAEFNGRLVVFPSTRRAGKSTLSLGLLAAGVKIFTDDFLPLQISEQNIINGISQGISPRLRLPLPDQAGPQAKAYSQQQSYTQNRQYRYVAPKKGDAAAHGDTAPLGALVFLERKASVAPCIESLDQSEVLTALIKQNFSRAMNASAILNVLSAITTSAPAYRLIFDEVEPAVAFLRSHFDQWSGALATIDKHDFHRAPEPDKTPTLHNWQSLPLTRMPGVSETIVDNKRFLSGRNNSNIVFLNEGAAGIWQLLASPITQKEIVALLSAAFPAHDPAAIERDTTTTLQAFVHNQLVTPSEPIEDDPAGFGGYAAPNSAQSTHPNDNETHDR